jgi:hypothetical protein
MCDAASREVRDGRFVDIVECFISLAIQKLPHSIRTRKYSVGHKRVLILESHEVDGKTAGYRLEE